MSKKRYWRSLEELENTPEFQAALAREFPDDDGDGEKTQDGTSRRHFLGLMGASIALSGVTGCVRRPVQHLRPYSKAPEDLVPGIAQHYATGTHLAGRAVGLVVEAHEGRPTKIEGNPEHPQTFGGTTGVHQALVLNLFDPARLKLPMKGDKASRWADALAGLKAQFDALKANGGNGLVVLSESLPSPTARNLRERFQAAYPGAKWFTYESVHDDNQRAGTIAAFGSPHVAVHRLNEARVVVSLDCDFLGAEGDVVLNSNLWARNRRLRSVEDKMSRLYAVEGVFSVTGTNADHRLRVKSSEVESVVLALAAELAKDGQIVLPEDLKAQAKPTGKPALDKFVAALAKDLAAQRNGPGSLLLAGRRQSAVVHATVAALNHVLGNNGRSVHYFPDHRRFEAEGGDMANIKAVTDLLNGGAVDTLLVLGVNPVYTAPGDLAFGDAFKKAKTKIALAEYADETARLADWALPKAHFLETWGDVVGTDGTVTIQQPTIQPIWGGKSEIELLALALGEAQTDGRELVREYWKKREGAVGFYKKWRTWLADGFSKQPFFGVTPSFKAPAGLGALQPSAPVAGLEVAFVESLFLFDGRFANNPWLLEMPDPISKVTWDNPVAIGFATAEKLGLSDGDKVSLEANGKKLDAAVVVVAGLADDQLVAQLGWGRDFGSFLPYHENGVVGFNVNPVRSTGAPDRAAAKLTATGGQYVLARTQVYSKQDPGFGYPARALVREADYDDFQKNPKFAKSGILEHGKPRPKAMVVHPPEKAIYEELKYDSQYQWGMAIDLNACTGCGTCMVACSAENNISPVGKDQTRRGREMHWIRMDRYFVSDEGKAADDVQVVHQPLGCQHCENAPCENVCPVAATSHSPEGLNEMAYNRCIGTRYCANNCPFKVRRFNFYNYAKDYPETLHMGRNPNVTVRFRGVIEKCTYCVQRINAGRIASKKANSPEAAKAAIDAITPACAQACPTDAIVFGNISDKDSAVSKARALDREYRLLTELNVKPRTSYLAKVRNPNPELGS